MNPRKILAHDWVVDLAGRSSHVDQSVEHTLHAQRHGGGIVASFEGQQLVGYPPAIVHVADDIADRCAGFGEVHLVEVVTLDNVDNRPDFDARLVHGTEQERNASVFRCGRVRATQDKDPVCGVALGGPDLLTVDDPLVAVVDGTSTERCEIGAGIRLGVTLAPSVFTRKYSR